MLKLGGGWAWTRVERGLIMRLLAYATGGSCNFQLSLGGGSSYSITLIGGTHLSLGTNGTVDHTCYIKHSRLEFLLKYSPTG